MRWMSEYKLNDRMSISRLKSLTQLKDITATIKRSKAAWYGHLRRSSLPAKMVTEGKIPGSRKRGRPSRRWLDDIKDWTGCDFQQLCLASTNRDEWSRICNNLHWDILFMVLYLPPISFLEFYLPPLHPYIDLYWTSFIFSFYTHCLFTITVLCAFLYISHF